jgi:ribosomal protein L11 methyltransferase
MTGSFWRVTVDLSDIEAAGVVVDALGEQCAAVSAFERGAGWRIEGISRDKPNRALHEALFTLLDPSAIVTVEHMPARDWVTETQAGFPPIRTGRFFVYGSHYRGQLPSASVPILIDAATAFGTGEHATTRGCLLAMERVARRPRRVLDIGCGTGILAIAAAKYWHRSVLVFDIDPEAVRVTRINARRNRVAGAIRAAVACGYRHHAIARAAPFDLVFANILARPLMAMAPDLARTLAPAGIAILSGLLARQEAMVLAAHRAQGLYLVGRIALEGWHTLIVAKRAY